MTGVVIDPHLAQCLRDNEPTEPADCLAALVQRRAECEELRAEVARLREERDTFRGMFLGAVCPKPATQDIADIVEAVENWVNRLGGETTADQIAVVAIEAYKRAALTDGGRE
jgi:hypothetical protein